LKELLLIALILAVLVFTGAAVLVQSAALAKTTTLTVRVDNLQGQPLGQATVTMWYMINNRTITHSYFTLSNGSFQAQLELNTSVQAYFNVTYLQTLVLTRYPYTLTPNSTNSVNLEAVVVNVSYSVRNPYGGYLTPVGVFFAGLAATNVSHVTVSLNAPNGSVQLPAGSYNLSISRGPVFYSNVVHVNAENALFNVTAPLLRIGYSVVSIQGGLVQHASASLLYNGALVNFSTSGVGTFSGLLPGTYTLTVDYGGLTNSTIIPLGSNANYKVEVPYGYTLNIQLLDTLGSPLQGYSLTLSGPVNASAMTDSHGRAVVSGLAQGVYVMNVYKGSQLVYATLENVQTSYSLAIQIQVYGSHATPATNLYTELRFAIGGVLVAFAALIFVLPALRKEKH
jgi:hypothetical protein